MGSDDNKPTALNTEKPKTIQSQWFGICYVTLTVIYRLSSLYHLPWPIYVKELRISDADYGILIRLHICIEQIR